MPVDVMVVVGDPGEGRAPRGRGGCLEVVRRLKADIARGISGRIRGEQSRLSLGRMRLPHERLSDQRADARALERRVTPPPDGGLLSHYCDDTCFQLTSFLK